MSAKLKKSLREIKGAKCPEDIFGDLKNEEELKSSYRNWCKVSHEDLWPKDEKHLAHEAFIYLNKLFEEAKRKILNKTYGDRKNLNTISISGKLNTYQITEPYTNGDISDIYKEGGFLIKIARSQIGNILLDNEQKKLSKIREDSKGLEILNHLPDFHESFEIINDGKNLRVNVFKNNEKLITLQEIIKAYPDGIDVRDMAWMFNRMMGSILAAHQSKIIHGAITPKHILLNIETHNGVLVDWCYSVDKQSLIKNIVPEYKHLYPKDVFDKKPADEGYDLYMLAKCMLEVVGQKNIPRQIKGLLNACLLGYTHRSKNVWALYQEFSNALLVLYGPKKFRTFVMPD